MRHADVVDVRGRLNVGKNAAVVPAPNLHRLSVRAQHSLLRTLPLPSRHHRKWGVGGEGGGGSYSSIEKMMAIALTDLTHGFSPLPQQMCTVNTTFTLFTSTL